MTPIQALNELVRVLDILDLSDDHTFNNAEPGELVSCTRPIEIWKELREAQKNGRSVLQKDFVQRNL